MAQGRKGGFCGGFSLLWNDQHNVRYNRGSGIALQVSLFFSLLPDFADNPVLRVTLGLSSSQKHSFATSIAFLLAPARAVLHAVPYTEPFAAFFTFAGMLAFVRRQNLSAALLFAFGSTFRAQGAVIGLGFFGWRYILKEPFRKNRVSIQVRTISTPEPACTGLTQSLDRRTAPRKRNRQDNRPLPHFSLSILRFSSLRL